MRKISFIIIVLFSVFGAYASDLDRLRKQAKKSKKQGNFLLAENIYQQILKEDTSKADVIAYLQLLLRNQKYNEAKLFIEQDYVKHTKDKTIKRFSDEIARIEELQLYDSDVLKLRHLNINSTQNDKVLTYFSNGFLYLKSKKNKNSYSKSFLFTNLDVDFQESMPFKFQDILNREVSISTYHSASKTLYYECNFNGKKNKNTKSGYQHSGIFYAKKDDYTDKWIDYNSLPFNGSAYTIMQPSISNNGYRLYFVSDMPGGYGGLDIYYTDFQNYTWSYPVNLGKEVNTPFDEMYPFIYEDSVLYYSTEGRAGLGGLDIFEYELTGKNKTSVNIGAPFNSNADDYGFKKHPKLNYGFFNSNRIYVDKKNNDDNIYQFTLNKLPARFIPVRVIDSTKKENLSNVKLTVLTNKTKDVSFYLLTAGFTNELKFEINEIYKIIANVPGYEEISQTVKIAKNQKELVLYVNTKTDKSKTVILGTNCNASGVFKDFSNKENLTGVKVLLIDLRDNSTVDSMITDESGKYFFKNLVPNNVYSISYSKKGYEPNGKYINTPTIDKIITDPHMGNVITNFIMYEKSNNQIPSKIKFNNNQVENTQKVNKVLPIADAIVPISAPKLVPTLSPIVVEPTPEDNDVEIPLKIENKKITKVFFKRNSYQLNDITKVVLDKYLEALNTNPNSIIVIVSHTDASGDAEYNRLLSIKRANETANHFIENGIDPKRIFAWGKGETQPLFFCDETVRCSPKQIAANRRTEIKIIYK